MWSLAADQRHSTSNLAKHDLHFLVESVCLVFGWARHVSNIKWQNRYYYVLLLGLYAVVPCVCAIDLGSEIITNSIQQLFTAYCLILQLLKQAPAMDGPLKTALKSTIWNKHLQTKYPVSSASPGAIHPVCVLILCLIIYPWFTPSRIIVSLFSSNQFCIRFVNKKIHEWTVINLFQAKYKTIIPLSCQIQADRIKLDGNMWCQWVF